MLCNSCGSFNHESLQLCHDCRAVLSPSPMLEFVRNEETLHLYTESIGVTPSVLYCPQTRRGGRFAKSRD